MISPGQHVSIFGMSGSGKSTLTRNVSRCFPRRIIFDRLAEWQDPGAEYAHDFESFALIYQELFPLREFEIVVRPRAGTSPDELTGLADQVLALVYQVEAYEARGIAVVFEEVWLYAPLFSTPPWFLEILLTGRHHNISIVGNSQRPANVSKTLVTQSRHVFVGEFFEMNDRKYYRECFGDVAWLENPPRKFTFYWHRADGQAPGTPQLISVSPLD